LQLGVFGFSGDEDGDVGVGIFPGGEEILVREASFGGVALKGPRPPELELSERIQIAERPEATVVENRLERGGSLVAILLAEERLATDVEPPICGQSRSIRKFVLPHRFESRDSPARDWGSAMLRTSYGEGRLVNDTKALGDAARNEKGRASLTPALLEQGARTGEMDLRLGSSFPLLR
jgi:hypothetical protein